MTATHADPSFAAITDQYLEALLAQLTHDARSGRAEAARSLGYLGRRAAFMLLPLAQRAKDDASGDVRRECIQAVGLIAWATGNVRGAAAMLEAALYDPEWAVRATAAAGLIRVGPAAERALIRLDHLAMNDGNPVARRNTAEAATVIRVCTNTSTWLGDLDGLARAAEARVLDRLLLDAVEFEDFVHETDTEQLARARRRRPSASSSRRRPSARVRRCRVCRCTNEAACDGGCSWVAADLCSRCSVPAGKRGRR